MDLILNEKLNIEDTLPVQFAHRDVEKNWSLSLVNDYNKCYMKLLFEFLLLFIIIPLNYGYTVIKLYSI
jgi:hypothetical protein